MIRDDDRGFRFGDGLFETIRITERGPIALDRHIQRFRASAEFLEFPARSIEDGVAALHNLREEKEGLWRVTVTRDDPDAPLGGSGVVVVTRRQPAAARAPKLTCAHGAYLPDDWVAEHKSTSRLRLVEVARRARARGFDDAVTIANDGRVGETSTANVFLVIGSGKIVTPPAHGLLPGVTRSRILDALPQIEVTAVTDDMLLAAREIVLTSAGVGAVAAASLDGRPLLSTTLPRFVAALRDP